MRHQALSENGVLGCNHVSQLLPVKSPTHLSHVEAMRLYDCVHQQVHQEVNALRYVAPAEALLGPSMSFRLAATSVRAHSRIHSFIPEGTAVRVHTYSLHRDSRSFAPLTDTFWPERWIIASDTQRKGSIPNFVHSVQAFVPFAFGPANCVGKNLAMLEMRMLLCACVQQLDFELAGDLVTDPGRWERELGDYSVLVKGKLPALVTDRMR